MSMLVIDLVFVKEKDFVFLMLRGFKGVLLRNI
jgi:hypothetical protein